MKMMSHDNVVNEDFLRLTRLPRLWSLESQADPVRENVSEACHQHARLTGRYRFQVYRFEKSSLVPCLLSQKERH